VKLQSKLVLPKIKINICRQKSRAVQRRMDFGSFLNTSTSIFETTAYRLEIRYVHV